MARTARLDEPVVISTILFDGDESKYLRAYVYEESGTFVTSVDLLHRAFGFYHQTFVAPSEGQYTIVTIVYDDPSYLVECLDYSREGDVLFVSTHTAVNPAEVAAGVWDSILVGNHDIDNSAGSLVQEIKENVDGITFDLVADPSHSLPVINQNVLENRSLLQTDIGINKDKLDQIISDDATYHTSVTNQINSVIGAINTSSSDMVTYKNEILASIAVSDTKLDSISSQLSQLQNQTRFVAIVPQVMYAPDVGTKDYSFYMAIYDQDGAPEAPDLTPTVTITRSDGTIIVDDVELTQDGVRVGQYYYIFPVIDTAAEELLKIVFKVIENGVTSYIPRVSEIADGENDIATILNRVEYFGNITTENRSILLGADGLSVLHTEILANRADIGLVRTDLTQIKSQTDLIITNPATSSELTIISNKIDILPSLVDIETEMDIRTAQIKGNDSRDLTQVYDNERGTDGALLATDPRLAFLDVAISSRTDMTTSEIWEYHTRELTNSAPLSTAEVAKIWDYLVSSIGTAGSIGRYILDMLDEKNSARGITLAEAMTIAAPLAIEATSQQILGRVSDENDENEVILNSIKTTVDLIKPQTDLIVMGAALESSLVQHDADVNNALLGLEILANAVKERTDNLPNDPATESSVSVIPSNPLLSNDPRLLLLNSLVNLDEPISSRVSATDIPTDYSTSAEIAGVALSISDSETNILSHLSTKPDSAFFATTQASVEYIKSQTDLIMAGFVPGDDLHSIRDWQLSQAGTQLTAQQIWEYGDRELTQALDFTTVDDLDVQSEQIESRISNYFCRMTTTFNINLDQQVVLCWLDINGIMQLNVDSARVIIHDESGNEIWAQDSTELTLPGVIKFTQGNISSLIASSARNYIMRVVIHTVEGPQYTSTQPFFTVG